MADNSRVNKMENFLFVISFTISLINDYNDIDGAKKMMEGCNSAGNIKEFNSSRRIQLMINNLSYGNNQSLVEQITAIKDAYLVEQDITTA